MTEIRFQGIHKRFKDAVVVQDLSLTIADREFFTFVGPSGCGKSTVLNMVAGLDREDRGTISFDGAPINELPPGERDVAMVFQSYALYPHMTVYENIAFPLRIKKEAREKIHEEVRRVAILLGLEPLLDRRPKQLSGGQRQRVALGRAIIRRPRVFLMDEPLSNLDARLRIETRGELKRLHKQFPVTTIYVTHDQEEAMVLSDRIAVLFHGEIQQCGPPLEVYEKPANLFVAGFIGSPPMMFLDGDLFRDHPFFSSHLKRFLNKAFVVGIRPPDVVVSMQKEEALEGEVVLLEPIGHDTWVDGLWKGQAIKGRAGQDQNIPMGARVYFKIPPGQLHVFEKAGGKRMT